MKIAFASSISIISNFVLIASVIVLILEIRQNQTNMLAQSSYERTRMAIANEQANLMGATEVTDKFREGEEITEDELVILKLRDNQLMRYFENLHYLNSIDVLDKEIWEANVRGIESFCSRQKNYPDYPALATNEEFKYRTSFVEFFKTSCGLE
jgi:hypothetical protein